MPDIKPVYRKSPETTTETKCGFECKFFTIFVFAVLAVCGYMLFEVITTPSSEVIGCYIERESTSTYRVYEEVNWGDDRIIFEGSSDEAVDFQANYDFITGKLNDNFYKTRIEKYNLMDVKCSVKENRYGYHIRTYKPNGSSELSTSDNIYKADFLKKKNCSKKENPEPIEENVVDQDSIE